MLYARYIYIRIICVMLLSLYIYIYMYSLLRGELITYISATWSYSDGGLVSTAVWEKGESVIYIQCDRNIALQKLSD